MGLKPWAEPRSPCGALNQLSSLPAQQCNILQVMQGMDAMFTSGLSSGGQIFQSSIEWLVNITNLKMRRAYKGDVQEFISFTALQTIWGYVLLRSPLLSFVNASFSSLKMLSPNWPLAAFLR